MQRTRNIPVRGFCCPRCGNASEIYLEPPAERRYTSSDMLSVAFFGWLGWLSVSANGQSELNCGKCGKRFARPMTLVTFVVMWIVFTFITAFITYVMVSATTPLDQDPAPSSWDPILQEVARNPRAALLAFSAAILCALITLIVQATKRHYERHAAWHIRCAQEQAAERAALEMPPPEK